MARGLLLPPYLTGWRRRAHHGEASHRCTPPNALELGSRFPIASAQSPNRPKPESLLHVADYHERIPDHGEPRPADARGAPMSNYLPRGTLHFED